MTTLFKEERLNWVWQHIWGVAVLGGQSRHIAFARMRRRAVCQRQLSFLLRFIQRYCRDAIDENCVRHVQFMKELIDRRDYEADCLLTE